jgi:hypothetical protein
MIRVGITVVFALMVSATAWAGNWNKPVNKNIDASAIRKALAEDGLGLLRFEIPSTLISPTAKAPVSISEKSFLGKKSIKFQLHHGDCGEEAHWNDCKNDRERTELLFEKESPYQEKWYRFVIYIPSTNKSVAPSKLHFIQWRTLSKPGKVVMMFMQLGPGLIFHRSADSFRDSYLLLVSEHNLYDRWIEIIVNTNWHHDPTKGFTKVWVDGEMKVDFQGPSYPQSKESFSLRYGLYSSYLYVYKNVSGKTVIPTREVFFDGVKSERSCEKLLSDTQKCQKIQKQTVRYYTEYKYTNKRRHLPKDLRRIPSSSFK